MRKGVILKNNVNKKDLIQKIHEADVCISDFDYTDAFSPARELILSKINIFDKRFRNWAKKYISHIGNIDDYSLNKLWLEFENAFISDTSDIKKATSLIEKKKEKLIFYGIKEFYENIFYKKPKIYITRSPEYLVKPIADFLGIDETIVSPNDKVGNLEMFIKSNPSFKKYFLKCDSEIDNQMLSVLNVYKNSGDIQYFVSCYVAKNKRNMNNDYCINLVGRDYNYLSSFLKDKR